MTVRLAVPASFLAVGMACLWSPAPTTLAAVLLLAAALLVPPTVLLGTEAVIYWRRAGSPVNSTDWRGPGRRLPSR